MFFPLVPLLLGATYNVGGFSVTISDEIPANEKIRGAIATQLWNPMVTEGVGKSELDAFIVEQRLVKITSGFIGDNLSMDEIEAEYQDLVESFEALAVQANRPELRYVGFIFQGCSVNGARSMSAGFGNPERTIAAMSFCGRNYALFDLLPSFEAFMPELSFPHLQTSNGGDTDRVGWNDDTVRQVRQEGRGLWSASLHPKLGHCESGGDGVKFELLWLREAIKARVPAVIPDWAYALKPLTDSDGWLGDYAVTRSSSSGSVWGTGYKFVDAAVFAPETVADASQYIWFPSRVAAEEWKNYADTGTCCLGVVEEPAEETPPEDPEDPVDFVDPVDPDGETPEEPAVGTPEEPGTPPVDELPQANGELPPTAQTPDDTTDSAGRSGASVSGQSCSAGGAGTFVSLVGLLLLRRRFRAQGSSPSRPKP